MSSPHYLSSLFEPGSVAVIGASELDKSVGRVIFANIREAGFRGKLHAVNPKYQTVMGQKCYRSVEDIGGRIDLVIIVTPARTIPAIMEQCGRSGVRHAVIVTSGFASGGPAGTGLERKILETARAAGVRVLGPNSIGIVRPDIGLNAAFTKIGAAPGDLALVSQSGAMCSVVLDWAATHKVGFSSVISLTTATDVDFGEVLDYLIHDGRTRYILMY